MNDCQIILGLILAVIAIFLLVIWWAYPEFREEILDTVLLIFIFWD